MPFDNITIRPISPSDAENGLFSVLSQLTQAPPIPPDQLAALIEQERRAAIRHTVVAVDDRQTVIATGAVFFETKYIRGGATCAHIEDIVVDKDARGMNLGKRIILHLVELARKKGCYKVILDCSDTNIPFYEKCGFQPKERQMTLYF